MKKQYLTEMENDRRDYLIKLNKKLIEMLQADLYEYNTNSQEEEGRELLGKNWHEYIETKDNYNSFYLILKNWSKFIDNLNAEYLAKDEALALYKDIKNKQTKLYNMNCYDDGFEELDEEIENDCKKLLKYCEDQLHEYEELPSEDEAIQYADEMEQLSEYYIELWENGESDNVIRKDIAYTECYI